MDLLHEYEPELFQMISESGTMRRCAIIRFMMCALRCARSLLTKAVAGAGAGSGKVAARAEVDQPRILGDSGLGAYFASLIWPSTHRSFSLATQSSPTSPQAESLSPPQGASYRVLAWITM